MSLGHGASIVRDGLVLHLDAANPKSYPGTGTVWKDLSGNGNNGTLVNGVGYNSANNGSMVFDGIDDNVNCGSIIGNFNASNFSISFWFKTSTTGSNCAFIAKSIGNVPTSDYGWLFNNPGSTNELGFACASITGAWGISGAYSIKTIGANVNSNTWKMATLTAQRSDADVKIYINDILMPLTDYVGGSGKFNMVSNLSNNYPLRIGAESDNLYINSSISGVQIYNRALSAAEIQQNFNATRGRYGI